MGGREGERGESEREKRGEERRGEEREAHLEDIFLLLLAQRRHGALEQGEDGLGLGAWRLFHLTVVRIEEELVVLENNIVLLPAAPGPGGGGGE